MIENFRKEESEEFLGYSSILVILKHLLEKSFSLCGMQMGLADEFFLGDKHVFLHHNPPTFRP